MTGSWRRARSLVALAVLILLALGYRFLPEWSPPSIPNRDRPAPAPEFHRFDRALAEALDGGGSPCLTCHPAAAHQRNRLQRAFLNLHRRALDCGVCHLGGRDVLARHFRYDQVVTSSTLPDAPYGRVYASRRAAGGWQRIETPSGSVSLRGRGPACGSCHRRGSTLLAADGLVDPYRRRVLEDLSVLRFMGGEQ